MARCFGSGLFNKEIITRAELKKIQTLNVIVNEKLQELSDERASMKEERIMHRKQIATYKKLWRKIERRCYSKENLPTPEEEQDAETEMDAEWTPEMDAELASHPKPAADDKLGPSWEPDNSNNDSAQPEEDDAGIASNSATEENTVCDVVSAWRRICVAEERPPTQIYIQDDDDFRDPKIEPTEEQPPTPIYIQDDDDDDFRDPKIKREMEEDHSRDDENDCNKTN